MNKTKLLISIILLLAIVKSDLSQSSFGGDFSSSELGNNIPLSDLVNIANYYGCKTWIKGKCVECSDSFMFNKKGVCCEIDPFCQNFNTAEGVCESCYQGYTVYNGSCVLGKIDVGCTLWNGAICIQCSQRWYFSKSNICVPVSDLCYTWNADGSCTSCYGGYAVLDGKCVIDNRPSPVKNNPYCSLWDENKCIKCAKRSYFDINGNCSLVSDQCATWDKNTGVCLSCYGGYDLDSGSCIKSSVTVPSDPGCYLWNSLQSICLQCSKRWYFNDRKACLPVSDLCKTWNDNGKCLTCYKGYDLSQGSCVLSRITNPIDVGCSTWDWENQICLACSKDWIFINNVCQPVSTQCKTFDNRGLCTSCYNGYTLDQNGACSQSPIQNVTDEGCAIWDWTNQFCIQCSYRYFFDLTHKCQKICDACNTFNSITGQCTSCYDGYTLGQGCCNLAKNLQPKDVGCSIWDWKNQICIKCSYDWVSVKGWCVPVSDQCKSWDNTGACTTCYPGYALSNGACKQSAPRTVSDAGCAVWDWTNQICITCSQDWVKINGTCVIVSDQCKSFDNSGVCTSCYVGYNLANGKCTLAPIKNVSDVGCALWDWKNQICLSCSKGWVFVKDVCKLVSDQCKSWDNTGACISCYPGYALSNGACKQSAPRTVSDVGCALWDWTNQICITCSQNWVKINGVCVIVSDQCKSFDNSGVCTSCYVGYNLAKGKCTLAPIQKVTDVGCALWDWTNLICIQCSKRYYMSDDEMCLPVSDNCNTYNSKGVCTSCYNGYNLFNGVCVLSNSLCQTSDANGACTDCYNGYILNSGNCVPLSKLANLALYYSACCPEKLAALRSNVDAAMP